jgi:hypothetical protein
MRNTGDRATYREGKDRRPARPAGPAPDGRAGPLPALRPRPACLRSGGIRGPRLPSLQERWRLRPRPVPSQPALGSASLRRTPADLRASGAQSPAAAAPAAAAPAAERGCEPGPQAWPPPSHSAPLRSGHRGQPRRLFWLRTRLAPPPGRLGPAPEAGPPLAPPRGSGGGEPDHARPRDSSQCYLAFASVSATGDPMEWRSGGPAVSSLITRGGLGHGQESPSSLAAWGGLKAEIDNS